MFAPGSKYQRLPTPWIGSSVCLSVRLSARACTRGDCYRPITLLRRDTFIKIQVRLIYGQSELDVGILSQTIRNGWRMRYSAAEGLYTSQQPVRPESVSTSVVRVWYIQVGLRVCVCVCVWREGTRYPADYTWCWEIPKITSVSWRTDGRTDRQTDSPRRIHASCSL